MQWSEIIIGFFCLFSILGACSLLAFRDPVNSAIGLLGVMISLAGIYALLGAHLIAGFQVIIYAGAIMIFIVYIIMLLDLKSDDYQRLITVGKILSVILMITSAFVLARFLWGTSGPMDSLSTSNYGTSVKIAEKLFTDYLLPFEISSLLLLMAMVGSIALAKKGEY